MGIVPFRVGSLRCELHLGAHASNNLSEIEDYARAGHFHPIPGELFHKDAVVLESINEFSQRRGGSLQAYRQRGMRLAERFTWLIRKMESSDSLRQKVQQCHHTGVPFFYYGTAYDAHDCGVLIHRPRRIIVLEPSYKQALGLDSDRIAGERIRTRDPVVAQNRISLRYGGPFQEERTGNQEIRPDFLNVDWQAISPPGILDGKRELIRKAMALREFAAGPPISRFRDAIVAEQLHGLEKWLPIITGKKEPDVSLFYGFMHLTIPEHARNEKWRQETLTPSAQERYVHAATMNKALLLEWNADEKKYLSKVVDLRKK